MTQVTNWSLWPKVEAAIHRPRYLSACPDLLRYRGMIARGLGRSYGDASLSRHIIDTLANNRIREFDSQQGILDVEAGASIAELLPILVAKKWFLPVTPGTKYVTIGGAIAADIHGKNHHQDGSFCNHVLSMQLLNGHGQIMELSQHRNLEVMRATCGGMGLTGIILSARLRLKKINSSFIHKNQYRAKDLDSMMDFFCQHQGSSYSVAWVDCLASKRQLGKGLFMVGEHADASGLKQSQKSSDGKTIQRHPFNMPFYLPSLALNKLSIKAFNLAYYHQQLRAKKEALIHYDPFFYPLDFIGHWNRLYSRSGFLQYQVVLPMQHSRSGLLAILDCIRQNALGSFLAVLKKLGPANDNFLSFPMEGFTLALDFPIRPGLFVFLQKLDKLTLKYQGRLYLAKDARMSKVVFDSSYPNSERFRTIKRKIDAKGQWLSLLWQRIGE